MSFKDILAMVVSTEDDASVISIAEGLAASHEGRATALLLEIQPDPVSGFDVYVVSEVWSQALQRAKEGFAQEKTRLEARLAQSAQPLTLRTTSIPVSLVGSAGRVEARYADVTILAQPGNDLRMALFEGVLFGAGRPVLLAPPRWRERALGRNVVIGWNASREAARALADAAPFLDRAERITVLTVDAKPSWSGHGGVPGADVAAHLARRGLKVEVRNADGLGRSDGAALLDECRAIGADLLVIGGYGRSRLQETIFGGATREVVSSSPIPVFLSH